MKHLSRTAKLLVVSALLTACWVVALAAYLDLAIFSARRTALFAVLIALVCFGIIFLVLRLLQAGLGNISRREGVVYLLLAVAMGGITLTFSPHPIRAMEIFPQRIHVESRNAPDCQPAVLAGFLSQGEFVSYNSFSIQGWQRQNNLLIAQPGQNAWSWQGFSSDVVLTFTGNANGCPVQITHGSETIVYDTIPAAAPDILVHLTFNQPAWVEWLTRLALILSLTSFFLGCILALRRVFSTSDVPQHQPWLLPNERVYLIICAAAALAAFYLATRQFGLFIVGDSTSYFSAGRSLAAGEGYIMYDGEAYDWWPPMPALLVAAGFLQKIIPLDGYLVTVNAILFTLNSAGWLLLLFALFPALNRPLLTAFVLIASFSRPLLGSSVFLLSEASFVVPITWGFVFLLRYFRTRSVNDVIAFCLCVELVTLSRYIGITFVLAAALMIFLFVRGGFFRRGLHAAAAGLFSSMMMIFWILRNRALSGSFTGWRTPAWYSFSENLQLTINTVAGWFAPRLTFLGAVLLVAPLILFIVWFIATHKDRLHPDTAPAETKTAASMVIFILVYCVYLLVSLSIVSNARIGDRLLAPIFVSLFSVIIFLINGIRWRLFAARSIAAPALTAILILSISFSGVSNLLTLAKTPVITHYDRISLYSLRGDQVLAYLKENPLKGDLPVYSNCPYCLVQFLKYYNVLIYADVKHTKTYLNSEKEPFYLVWMARTDMLAASEGGRSRKEGSYFSPLTDPAAFSDGEFSLTPLLENADGGVYLVTPR